MRLSRLDTKYIHAGPAGMKKRTTAANAAEEAYCRTSYRMKRRRNVPSPPLSLLAPLALSHVSQTREHKCEHKCLIGKIRRIVINGAKKRLRTTGSEKLRKWLRKWLNYRLSKIEEMVEEWLRRRTCLDLRNNQSVSSNSSSLSGSS